jgi:transposase
MDGRRFFKANAFLWEQNQRLLVEGRSLGRELAECRRELSQAQRSSVQWQKRAERLKEDNRLLRRRVADLTARLKAERRKKPKAEAAKVGLGIKPGVRGRRKKPGRPEGHPAALRPVPAKIDVHQPVPLPVDPQGKSSCPHCRTRLSDVRGHERLVEEIIPAKLLTTCYHTESGYCPCCRKRIESRAAEQPPASDLPHAQLGLNALATAAVMRVCYRLPLRQVSSLLAQLPGLKVSAGGVSRQINRLGQWLEGQYHRLKLVLRAAGVVYADETSWRTDGRNGYLWTLTNDSHTLYHVDRSRAGRVLADLLGDGFGAEGRSTLVSDFYGVYDRIGGARASRQKCNTHLLRELKETVGRRPELASHAFFKRCKRLVKEMLELKRRREQLTAEAYAHQVGLAEKRLEKLAALRWGDADADRLAARLSKHRKSLTTFLHKAEVEPTNNAAERALRPAVVMRKITGGSRSRRGARAWSILASVMRTAQQQGRDVLETLKTLLKAQWAGTDVGLLTDTS